MKKEIHTINPVFDKNSKILILGSFPSVKSREANFFYGHPRNRFWRVLSAVLLCECPQTVDEKRTMLLENKIALWDVIKSCDIHASSDSSIKNVIPNDLSIITNTADVKAVFTNGNTAHKLFLLHNEGMSAVKLPSTSPANAAMSIERLIEEWKILRNFT